MSKGYILGSLAKMANGLKDKVEESVLWGFICGDSSLNDALSDSASVNLPKLIKGAFAKKDKKKKQKTLVGRKPLKRAQERVGAIDAAELPKGFGYVFGGAVKNSRIIELLNGIWSGFFNMQASLVGAMLMLTSISSFAVSLIKHIIQTSSSSDTTSLYFSTVAFLMSVLLIGSGTRSIYEVFTQSLFGSQFMKNVMGARLIDEKEKDAKNGKMSSSPKAFVVILFCLLICALSLWAGLEKVLLSCVLISLAIAILKMPESGIMMLLIAFPWIGTLERSETLFAVLSLFITFSWILKLSVGKRVYTVRFIDVVVALFLIYYLLAGVLTDAPVNEIHTSICYFVVGTLYFPIASLIRSSEWINRAMRAYTVGTVAVSFAGILQFVLRSVSNNGDIVFGITSAFNNNHTLGAYLSVGIFIGIFNLLEIGEHESAVGLKISLAMNLVCLALVASKTVYLAFLIAFLVFLLAKKPKLVGELLLSLPFLIAIWTMMPETIKEHMDVLLESTDVGIRSKMYVWNTVFDQTKDYWWFGIGTCKSSLGTVWSNCADYLPASLQFYNLYISIAVHTGIVGLVLLIVFVISALQRGMSVLSGSKKGSYFQNLSACTVSAYISIIVFSMGNSMWHEIVLFILFYFVIALVRCTREVYIRESVFEQDNEGLDVDISMRRKVKKQSKVMLAVLRLAARSVKRVKKLKTVAKQNNKTNEEILIAENNSNKVEIQEINLCEEESTWQRK